MRATDLERDIRAMREAVWAAAVEVMRHFCKSPDAWAKEDHSPVSVADLTANDILHDHLIRTHGDGYGWLSEESTDNAARLHARRVWVVDPIDGTRAFLKGQPHFTICVALIEKGEALASAVFNPATEELFEARAGGGATLNGQLIRASGCADLDRCHILGKPEMFSHPGWPRDWPDMRVSQRNSTNYRMALVASGEADAMLAIARKADWDAAPGALIAEEAGARVTDHVGDRFTYNQPIPVQRSIVCAAPALYRSLFDRVAHLPADFTDPAAADLAQSG